MIKKGNDAVLFVNSFRGSGIGDFGWKLYSELKNLIPVEYAEITPSWKGFMVLWRHIITANRRIIFNIGFTSYGKSMIRNFFGFLMLKFLTFMHKKSIVILHDSIDTSNLEVSGYKSSKLMATGGSIATKMIRRHTIVVFSKKFLNILKQKYSFTEVEYFPFPCEGNEITKCYNYGGSPLIVNLGYISPYKGLEILPRIKTLLGTVKIIVIGKFHHTLSSTINGKKFNMEFQAHMADSNIPLLGYMDESDVIKLMKENKSIAILPYVSGYNSSYSAILFVSLGIPVVATNIDLFLESKNNGAGIVVVDRTPDAFASAINSILNSPEIAEQLIEKDMKYCAQYSFHSFCNFLLSSNPENFA